MPAEGPDAGQLQLRLGFQSHVDDDPRRKWIVSGSGGEVDGGVAAPRPARTTTDRHSTLPQNQHDLCCGLTRPVEYLLVAEPYCRSAVDCGIQITLEIVVPGGCRIVKQSAVELYDQPPPIFDVAIPHARRRRRPGLSSATGRPCARSTRSR